jgi:hypothetical protein
MRLVYTSRPRRAWGSNSVTTLGGLYRVQKVVLYGACGNHDGRQCSVDVSWKLVRMRRSCWKRLSFGSALTKACVRFGGMGGERLGGGEGGMGGRGRLVNCASVVWLRYESIYGVERRRVGISGWRSRFKKKSCGG